MESAQKRKSFHEKEIPKATIKNHQHNIFLSGLREEWMITFVSHENFQAQIWSEQSNALHYHTSKKSKMKHSWQMRMHTWERGNNLHTLGTWLELHQKNYDKLVYNSCKKGNLDNRYQKGSRNIKVFYHMPNAIQSKEEHYKKGMQEALYRRPI